MERGERNIAIAVLGAATIIGVLAILTLFLQQPTGQIMQGESVYASVDADRLGIPCSNPTNQAILIGYERDHQVYCCIEHVIGQNECKAPQRIIIPRGG